MFLHIGNNKLVLKKDIILIIDIESVNTSEINKEYFNIASEEGFIINTTDDPKSYVITEQIQKMNGKIRDRVETQIFNSNISASTLLKRVDVDSNGLNRELIRKQRGSVYERK